MKIREAHNNDAEAIAKLSNQLGYPATDLQIQERLNILLELHDHQIIVAENISWQIVGWVHIFITMSLVVPPYAELGGLVVDDNNHRKGVGSMLLYAAESWAWKEGCTMTRIRSNTIREVAHLFYLARGYRTEKSQYVFIKRLNGGGKIHGN